MSDLSDRSIIVYWRWAWLGVIPAIYLSFVLRNAGLLFGSILVYVGAGLIAHINIGTVRLPAATVGSFAYVGLMLMISKYFPVVQEMWNQGGQATIWAVAYVGAGAAAVLFLGIVLDPIYSKKASPPEERNRP